MYWNDDDWFAPWRIKYQVEQLLKEEADICGLDRLFFHDQESDEAWEYVYSVSGKPWLSVGTFCGAAFPINWLHYRITHFMLP